MKTTLYRAALVVVTTLAIVATGNAIEIDKANRIENPDPGYCAYCSVEMLARQHGVDGLTGLVARRQQVRYYRNGKWVEDGGAYVPEDLTPELDKAKVKYWKQSRGNKDVGILIRATDKDYGCVVGLKDYPNADNRHAVVMLSFGKEVLFLDPNHVDQVRSVSREWFLDHWSGGALVLVVDKGDGPPPAFVVKNERQTDQSRTAKEPTDGVVAAAKPADDPTTTYQLAPVGPAGGFRYQTGAPNSSLLYKPQVSSPTR